MKRPLAVDLELEADRRTFGFPTETEKYLDKIEKYVSKMEKDLEKAKKSSVWKNTWSGYGNVM